MERKSILLFIFIISSVLVCAQEEVPPGKEVGKAKNVIGFSGGMIIFHGAYTGHFERRILPTSGIFNGIWVRVGAGRFDSDYDGGHHIKGGFYTMTGMKNHHVEFSLAAVALFDRENYVDAFNRFPGVSKSDYWSYIMAPGISYRYQKPDGGLMTRVGVGFPETVFIGIGYAF